MNYNDNGDTLNKDNIRWNIKDNADNDNNVFCDDDDTNSDSDNRYDDNANDQGDDGNNKNCYISTAVDNDAYHPYCYIVIVSNTHFSCFPPIYLNTNAVCVWIYIYIQMCVHLCVHCHTQTQPSTDTKTHTLPPGEFYPGINFSAFTLPFQGK